LDAPLAAQTSRLLRLLDQVGATALDRALAEALDRQAISAASVAHLLEQRRRARRLPPPVELVLPACLPAGRPIRACWTFASRLMRSIRMTACFNPLRIVRRIPPMTPLADRLVALGLRVTAAHLDDVVALATKRRWSPVQLLEHLAQTEQQDRTRRSLERRLASSRIGRFTP
jgi:hypothetical protein